MPLKYMKCYYAFLASALCAVALVPLTFIFGKAVCWLLLGTYVLYLAYMFKVRQHAFFRGCFYAVMLMALYFSSLYHVAEGEKMKKVLNEYADSVIVH